MRVSVYLLSCMFTRTVSLAEQPHGCFWKKNKISSSCYDFILGILTQGPVDACAPAIVNSLHVNNKDSVDIIKSKDKICNTQLVHCVRFEGMLLLHVSKYEDSSSSTEKELHQLTCSKH